MNAPDSADIQNLVALLNAGQFEKGVSTAKRLIGRFPREPALHLLLGAGLAKQEKLDPAIHSYRKALALKPDYAEALEHLGFALHKQGYLTEAANAYSTAVKIQPANAKFQDSLGRIFEELGVGHFGKRQFADAVELFRKAVALRPKSGELLTNLGRSLFQLGEAEEAVSYLHQAQQLGPENISEAEKIRALAYEAIALKALGKPTAETLNKIFEIPTDHWESISIKMWAALASGDPERAFSYRPGKLNVMSWGDLGSLYRRSDLREKIQRLPKLMGSLPHQSSRPLLYAGGDGVYAERFARELIESALSKSPDCDFHIHLMNLGTFNPDEAFKMFPKDRVTWTIEDMGPCDKILFAPRRWIRLAQIQWQVERKIILIDTDTIVNGDIPGALPEQFDVVLYDRSEDPWAHQMVMGAFIAISPGGRDFTDFLAAYILHFEDAKIPKWFDDQFNMVAAREWFRRHVPDMAIKDCPKHMLDWTGTHRPECLVWHAKGDLKQNLKFAGSKGVKVKEMSDDFNAEAIAKRATLPDHNTFGLDHLGNMPGYFGWVDCTSGHGTFKMLAGGNDDAVVMRFFWNGSYERTTLRTWAQLAKKVELALDIGAHTGAFSLAAKASNPQIHVISFEPHFMNYGRLTLNLRVNAFPTSNAFMMAVGEKNEQLPFSIGSSLKYLPTGGSIGVLAPGQKGHTTQVQVVSIDSFLAKEHWPKVGLVKIDTEGYEPACIAGMKGVLAAARPMVFFECIQAASGAVVQKSLKALGYKFFEVDDIQDVISPVTEIKPYLDASGKPVDGKVNRIALPEGMTPPWQ